MPVLPLTIYWCGFNRVGATAGLLGGLIVSVGFVPGGPGRAGREPPLPAVDPGAGVGARRFRLLLAGQPRRTGRERATGVPYDDLAARAFSLRATKKPEAEVVP